MRKRNTESDRVLIIKLKTYNLIYFVYLLRNPRIVCHQNFIPFPVWTYVDIFLYVVTYLLQSDSMKCLWHSGAAPVCYFQLYTHGKSKNNMELELHSTFRYIPTKPFFSGKARASFHNVRIFGRLRFSLGCKFTCDSNHWHINEIS